MGNIEISRTIFPAGTRGEDLLIFNHNLPSSNHVLILPQEGELSTADISHTVTTTKPGMCEPFMCFYSHHRCEHGDAGTKSIVGSWFKLWSWHWSWCGELLWSP